MSVFCLALVMYLCSCGAAENGAMESGGTEHSLSEKGNAADSTPALFLQVDDALYWDTGRISTIFRCGMMDGEITSTVAASETPSQDNQSNFGSGYGYQYSGSDTIDVNIDDQWHIFKRIYETDVCRIQITNGNTGEVMDVSEEIQAEAFWEIIGKYEALDVEKLDNQTKTMGYTYWLRFYNEAGEQLHSIVPKGPMVKIDSVQYGDYSRGTASELFLAVDALWEEEMPRADVKATDLQETEELAGVSMEVTYVTPKGANLVLTNDTDKNIMFGDDYILQVYQDGKWYEVDYIIDNAVFSAIGYSVPTGGSTCWSVKWNYFHGELPEGTYRIVKEVMDFRGTGDFTEYSIGAYFCISASNIDMKVTP